MYDAQVVEQKYQAGHQQHRDYQNAHSAHQQNPAIQTALCRRERFGDQCDDARAQVIIDVSFVSDCVQSRELDCGNYDKGYGERGGQRKQTKLRAVRP